MNTKCLLFLMGTIFSCSNSTVVNNNNKWEIVNGKGIDPENKRFYFLSFPKHDYGLLFGSSYSDENLLRKEFAKFNAIYYITNDGGINWIEKGLGKGKFTSYATKNNHVLLSKEISGGGANPDSTLVYYSNDHGETFKEFISFGDFFIRNIFIKSESEFYLIGKQSKENYWTLKGSLDGGKTWSDMIAIENNLQSPIVNDSELLYLTNRDDRNLIKKISLPSGMLSEIQLPSQIGKPYFITFSAENDLFIVGRSDKNICIYKSIENHFVEFSQLLSIDRFPVHMEIHTGSLYLILGERNSIGVTYSLYSRRLTLSNWDVAAIPSSSFSPFSFSESAIWGYSLDGRFYRKNLTSIATGANP